MATSKTAWQRYQRGGPDGNQETNERTARSSAGPRWRTNPVGMTSLKIQTAMRTGDLVSWDLDRLCAIAASCDRRVKVVLVPPRMRAVVAFEPA